MNENLKVCGTPQQETLTSLATSLIERTSVIWGQVENIITKLYGPRPCETENQPCEDLESLLRFVRNCLEGIAKDVYNINERL
jgi:DNA-binding FrmR family transcriptional regulator